MVPAGNPRPSRSTKEVRVHGGEAGTCTGTGTGTGRQVLYLAGECLWWSSAWSVHSCWVMKGCAGGSSLLNEHGLRRGCRLMQQDWIGLDWSVGIVLKRLLDDTI